MIVEYSSNNSGGSWWLKDKDWLALEKGGWSVKWGSPRFCNSRYPPLFPTSRQAPETCEKEKCPGHYLTSLKEVMNFDEYWLGAAAQKASKEFQSLAEGIQDWEKLVGQSASDEGCNCCGAPHCFSAEGVYVSGEEVIRVLFPKAPKSLREAAEREAEKA